MTELKLRYSKQRETIYEVLKSDDSHPNVDMIYNRVKQIIPDISLGTVYRNLNLLSDQKKIRRLDVGDGTIHFDATTSPHYHMVCDECGSITDIFISDEEILPLFNKVQEATQEHISSADILFHGICKGCLKHKS